MNLHLFLTLLSAALPAVEPTAALIAQSDSDSDQRFTAMEQRLQKLEAELSAAMDALAEGELLGGAGGEIDSGPSETQEIWAKLAQRRLAPRASAVYSAKSISIGGYGEFLGQFFRNQAGDNVDGLRWVMYLGSRFSDRWIFNSEIEIEHGTTGATSATTDSNGSVSIEFAYIDHLLTDNTALRGGIVLVPLGFINERHEPTTFLPSARPETETRIIPSTWRAGGLGGYGQVGPFAWTGYALNGLNGEEFNASGLRGGRQSGNRASIDDIAFVGRIDYVETPGLVAGASVYTGDAGANSPESLNTTIVDLHMEWNQGPFSIRGLYARSNVGNTEAFNARTGGSLAEEMEGWYVEGGFDLLSLTENFAGQSLDAFFRYEDIDTQKTLRAGATPGGGVVDRITTVGLNYRPLNQVVLKADYSFLDDGDDVVRFLIGYAF